MEVLAAPIVGGNSCLGYGTCNSSPTQPINCTCDVGYSGISCQGLFLHFPSLVFFLFFSSYISSFFRFLFSILPSVLTYYCPADYSTGTGNATWNAVNAPFSGYSGVCNSGYSGSPTRGCLSKGIWSSVLGGTQCTSKNIFLLLSLFHQPPSVHAPFTSHSFSSFCSFSGNYCPATSTASANWPATPSLTDSVSGTCNSGYSGSPVRDCLANGWSTNYAQCTPNCPTELVTGNATWPSTAASATGKGHCNSGFVGSPTRICLSDGSWASTVSGTPCTAASEFFLVIFLNLFFFHIGTT